MIKVAFQTLSKTISKHFVFIFFAIYLVLGLSVVNDYGIYIDEPAERTTSHTQYKTAYSKVLSFFGKEDDLIGSIQLNQDMLREKRDRYYGSFLHWPLVAIEHSTSFTMNPSQIYLHRHINTFVYFFLANIALYLILKKRIGSQSIAIMGPLLLILSPRFFAESFYNNKDILFASMYLISLYFALVFMEKKTLKRAVMASVVFGITINTRIIGLVIPLLLTIWSFISIVQRKGKKLVPMVVSACIPIISIAVYLITQPTSWGIEGAFLSKIVGVFSQFDWIGWTLYFGELIPWNNIPWHFTLGYLFVTTPIWYSFLFLGGLFTILLKTIKILKKPKKLFSSKIFKTDLFILAALLVPLVAVIVSHSVLYNSWRHMYFIYGPFIYIAALFLYSQKGHKKLISWITALVILINALWIFSNHPYQYLYFNPVVRSYAATNFETDYWGLGAIELLEYITNTDTRDDIAIYKLDYTQKHIQHFLDEPMKSRFVMVDTQEEADYLIHFHYNQVSEAMYEGFEMINEIRVGDIKGLSLYKSILEK